jgi:hypothetical protein
MRAVTLRPAEGYIATADVVTLAALAFQVGLASASQNSGQPVLIGTMDALFVVANLPLAVMLMAIAVLTIPDGRLPDLARIALGPGRGRPSSSRMRNHSRRWTACRRRVDERLSSLPALRALARQHSGGHDTARRQGVAGHAIR